MVTIPFAIVTAFGVSARGPVRFTPVARGRARRSALAPLLIPLLEQSGREVGLVFTFRRAREVAARKMVSDSARCARWSLHGPAKCAQATS